MNDLNIIINELCEKFNCAMDELIPAYAHYKIICCAIALIIFLLFFAANIYWLIAYKHKKYLIKDEFYVDLNGWISAMGIIIFGVISICIMVELFMWIVMPEMQFLNTICS